MDRLDMEAFARDLQKSQVIIYAHSVIATAALQGKAPGPVDPRPPHRLSTGHGGTYATHDPAKDIYPNGEWGPHHGWELRAPVPGAVEKYVMQTPLGSLQALNDPRRQRYSEAGRVTIGAVGSIQRPCSRAGDVRRGILAG
jgi:hypothetical protein